LTVRRSSANSKRRHYATERFGVQALAGLRAARFGVEARFFDVPNPL